MELEVYGIMLDGNVSTYYVIERMAKDRGMNLKQFMTVMYEAIEQFLLNEFLDDDLLDDLEDPDDDIAFKYAGTM